MEKVGKILFKLQILSQNLGNGMMLFKNVIGMLSLE